ncbi:MAG: site-specific integrase [Gemmatimonadetes bacterium]|nr:site-specific integrase [Gemmatimonadota bacterium]
MLSERIVRDAKPGPKNHIIWDSIVKGLGLRITPKGAKAYILSYRVNGRKRQATLARASEISLKAVRERAGEQLVRIRAGEADPLERKREARQAPTVSDGLRRFFDEFAPARLEMGRLSPRTISDYRWMAGRFLEPVLGKRKIADVTRDHIEPIVSPLPRAQRNRLLALTSRLFNLFEQWEWRPQHSNPCHRIERARVEARDRVLLPSELAALAKALNQHEEQHPASVAAIRVAALTGLRIGEVLGIQWQHIDFEMRRLTLPETKTGRRVHDLPAPALALLAELPRFSSTWTFTSTGTAAITYRTVRKHFAKIAAAAGIEDVRLHDLRRTVMTRAAASGVGTHVLRDLLGHKTTAMADRYIRAVGDPVREAREQVGAEMAAMMDGEGD